MTWQDLARLFPLPKIRILLPVHLLFGTVKTLVSSKAQIARPRDFQKNRANPKPQHRRVKLQADIHFLVVSGHEFIFQASFWREVCDSLPSCSDFPSLLSFRGHHVHLGDRATQGEAALGVKTCQAFGFQRFKHVRFLSSRPAKIMDFGQKWDTIAISDVSTTYEEQRTITRHWKTWRNRVGINKNGNGAGSKCRMPLPSTDVGIGTVRCFSLVQGRCRVIGSFHVLEKCSIIES